MKESVNRPALRIALIYAAAASLWILTSDWLLFGLLSPGEQASKITMSSVLKGLLFVAVTSVALYALVRSSIQRIYRAESRMHLLFSSINDSIFLFQMTEEGLPGPLLDANESAVRETGYSHDALLRLTPADLVPPRERPATLKALERLWREGDAVFEAVLVRRSGEEIPVEICARTERIGGELVCLAIARDLTERRREEEERQQAFQQAERDKRQFYRETILAVTGGHLMLGEEDEAPDWLAGAEFSARLPGPEHLSRVRHQAMDYCRRRGLTGESLERFELAVGEALANAVKHAGGGFLYAGSDDHSVWVAVVDHGKGMDTFTIPRIALVPGFTTKASMGLGFTIMLDSADLVRLATGSEGTTVWLQKLLEERSAPKTAEAVAV
ncbi:MAG: hypothetical protein KatS3mg024_0235 [Armatimonadota bacterium]|nr:MAG: hypothetical protein KatS3mg024_0235 [Armatimonadota bacterium]